MGRKIYIFIFIFIILLSPVLISARSNVSLDGVMTDIMRSQGISEKNQIECDRVTDEQFEELGETVMGLMHPDEKEHELMDQMMGGKGSESLKAAHILMGKRYLGCVSGMTGGMMGGGMMGDGMMGDGMMNMMPMIGRGMMGNWSNPNNSMMANMMNFGPWGAWGWIGWILMVLFWVLIILGAIVLIKWLIEQLTRARKEKSALDILKERYAKGEISKEEFEEKKKDLI